MLSSGLRLRTTHKQMEMLYNQVLILLCDQSGLDCGVSHQDKCPTP